MFVQLVIGAAIIVVSIVVQVGFVSAVFAAVERWRFWCSGPTHSLRRSIAVGAVALWLTLAHSIAIWLWAATFLALDVFHDLDTAFYFSAVAFTTLGFGDIIPPTPWRQLAALSAANGLLVFGVSAAVLVEVFRQLWSPRGPDAPAEPPAPRREK